MPRATCSTLRLGTREGTTGTEEEVEGLEELWVVEEEDGGEVLWPEEEGGGEVLLVVKEK